MNIEYLNAWLKTRQGCGWILAVFGGFTACIGLIIIVDSISEYDYGRTLTLVEWIEGILGYSIYIPILPIGILCLVIGIWLKYRKEKSPAKEEEGKRKNYLIWGWILVIFGGLFILLVGWLGIDTINSYYIVENMGENLFVRLFCCSTLLVVGILLVIFGRKLIFSAGK
jgi:hypothetical protein